MSIDTCKSCGQWVDTDGDCEAYFLSFEDGSEVELDYCLCKSCRENREGSYLSAREFTHLNSKNKAIATIIEELLDNPDKADEILARERCS